MPGPPAVPPGYFSQNMYIVPVRMKNWGLGASATCWTGRQQCDVCDLLSWVAPAGRHRPEVGASLGSAPGHPPVLRAALAALIETSLLVLSLVLFRCYLFILVIVFISEWFHFMVSMSLMLTISLLKFS